MQKRRKFLAKYLSDHLILGYWPAFIGLIWLLFLWLIKAESTHFGAMKTASTCEVWMASYQQLNSFTLIWSTANNKQLDKNETKAMIQSFGGGTYHFFAGTVIEQVNLLYNEVLVASNTYLFRTRSKLISSSTEKYK